MSITSSAELAGMVSDLAEQQATAYAEKYPSDVERAPRNEGESSQEYVGRVGEALRAEGKPGSAQFLETFRDVSLIVAERNKQFMGSMGGGSVEFSDDCPVLIDVEKTEGVLLSNEVVLTPEAEEDLLIGLNGLAYYIDRHNHQVRTERVNAFVEDYTRPRSIVEHAVSSARVLIGKGAAVETPLNLDEGDINEIQTTMSDKFINREDASGTLKRTLTVMARNKPRIVGLEMSADISKRVKELSQKLGGGVSTEEAPLSSTELDTLASFMPGQAMDELGIYPGYADQIREIVAEEVA